MPPIMYDDTNFELQDRLYPALTLEKASFFRTCSSCNKRFRYAIERIFHLKINLQCRLKEFGRCTGGKENVENLVLSQKDNELVELYCNRSMNGGSACNMKCSSILEYCLHIDSHLPVNDDLFPCYNCACVFFTPMGFYKHPCFNLDGFIDPPKLCKQTSTIKMFYNQIPKSEEATLSCPDCGKQFLHISHLIMHFRFNPSCKIILLRETDSKHQYNGKNLSILLQSCVSTGSLKSIFCEDCNFALHNQVSFKFIYT